MSGPDPQGTPAEPHALRHIGDGRVMASEIADLVGRTPLFCQFTRDELRELARFLDLYRADEGAAILREGEQGDTMLLLVQGRVEVYKRDIRRREKQIAVITPGETVGEMAMIDGEPRFATCVAAEPSVFALLSREGLARLIDVEPRLGAKILVQMLEIMNQRLRATGGILVNYLKIS